MAKYESDHPNGVSLCSVAAEITDLSGAAILLDSSEDLFTPLCAGNDVAQRLMDLEITLGEGPAIAASRSGAVVHESNLQSPEYFGWALYSPEALIIGARAVFAYPIHIGAARFASLSLYRDQPGGLSAAQTSDAYLMASVIGRAVLAMQAGAPGESLVGEVGGNSALDFTVHQAAGMLSVQASISVKDALVALRAHAFATNATAAALATRVVERSIRFDSESSDWQDAEGLTER
jgi:hypothetical protein